MNKLFASLLVLTLSLSASAKDLRTASYVDINRYIGKWYTITSLPQFFTRNCKAQTADYAIVNEKTISVLNTCLKEKGKSTIKGKAVVKNAKTNAELEVTFDSFFTRIFRVKGDYTIIKLDENYEHVLVGSKDRKSLWVLSRRPVMDEATLNEYVNVAKEEGFPVSKLERSEY